MTESAKDLIEKTIREYNDKIHAKVQELHRKQVNRERFEAELVEAKVEIANLESFVTVLVDSLTTVEDRAIMAGLKAQRRSKRGIRAHSQP
jgi:chromosome segregation ATPase